MNHIVNERKERIGRALATGASTSGVVLLITSLALPILEQRLFFSGPPLPLVILGLILSILGIRMANKWVRPPLVHQSLRAGLRGLGKQATAYHYYLPSPHVLICQHGVFSLSPVPHRIAASVHQDRWRRKDGLWRRLTSPLRQDALGDPTAAAILDARRLQRWLDKHLPGHAVTVQPIVVFTRDEARVEVGETSIPVLYADKRKPSLKQWIREQQQPTLSEEQVAQLEAAARIT
jgi:hypothetical protein